MVVSPVLTPAETWVKKKNQLCERTDAGEVYCTPPMGLDYRRVQSITLLPRARAKGLQLGYALGKVWGAFYVIYTSG